VTRKRALSTAYTSTIPQWNRQVALEFFVWDKQNQYWAAISSLECICLPVSRRCLQAHVTDRRNDTQIESAWHGSDSLTLDNQMKLFIFLLTQHVYTSCYFITEFDVGLFIYTTTVKTIISRPTTDCQTGVTLSSRCLMLRRGWLAVSSWRQKSECFEKTSTVTNFAYYSTV